MRWRCLRALGPIADSKKTFRDRRPQAALSLNGKPNLDNCVDAAEAARNRSVRAAKEPDQDAPSHSIADRSCKAAVMGGLLNRVGKRHATQLAAVTPAAPRATGAPVGAQPPGPSSRPSSPRLTVSPSLLGQRLHEEVKAPNSDGLLRVNLEDKAVNSKGGAGVSKGGVFGLDRGEPGSALTSGDAVQSLQNLGVQVTVFNTNPEGHPKNARMQAVALLGNGAEGGAQYALATVNRNPGEFQPDAVSYALPKGRSAEFVRGYNEAAKKIGAGQFAQAARQAGEAYIGTRSQAGQTPRVQPQSIVRTQPTPRTMPSDQPPGSAAVAPSRTLRSAAASQDVRKSIVPNNSAPRVPAPPSVQVQLDLRGLSAHKLTVASARDLLADAAAIGPNPVLPELAGWLQRAFPRFMSAGDGALGREAAQIVEGGAKAPVPKTLTAHAESRRWIRYNAGDLTTQHSAALAQVVASRFSTQRPLHSALDLGSGNGSASNFLLNQASKPKVTAIDGDGDALQRLAERAGLDASGRLTTRTGDVTTAAYGKNHDLVVAEKLFPHLSDTQVEAVLNKAHDAMSAKGLMVCDFYTTDHGSARSRGAQYRDEAQALSLIPASLRVIDKHLDKGILRLTLQKR